MYNGRVEYHLGSSLTLTDTVVFTSAATNSYTATEVTTLRHYRNMNIIIIIIIIIIILTSNSAAVPARGFVHRVFDARIQLLTLQKYTVTNDT